MKTHVLTLIALLLPLGAVAQWWTALGDSTLNSLERQALDANYDVSAAMHRVAAAQRQLSAVRAGYFPTVGLEAGWAKEARHEPSMWNLGATMSWEIDLFGRVYENQKQRKAQIRASRADLEGAQLSVAASVAQSYIALCSARERLALARQQADDQKKVANMVQVRYDTGLSDRLDLSQALTTYYSTCASVPPLETAVVKSLSALAVLLGVRPDSLGRSLDVAAALPAETNVVLPMEVPYDDLRTRPDVLAAEAQIDVAAASLGIAKKDYLPSLALTGSVATTHHSLNKLFTDESFSYSIAPTLTWTLFDGLARRANVAAAREEMEAAIDSYRQAVLSGAEELRNALTDFENSRQAVELTAKTVEQADLAMEKSIALYKLDLTTFTTVMQSQMSELTYRTQLIEMRAAVLNAFVDFHRALGH